MSTRAVIAERIGDRWRGVYCHSDGYPIYLGQELFRCVQDQYQGDVRKFLDETVIAHPKGWSIFPDRCYCHGGYPEDDPEMIIEGCDCHHNPWDNRKDYGGYQRPAVDEVPMCDPLSIEWVYVFDPHAKTMAVIEHFREELECVDPTSKGHHLNCHTIYRHRIKAVVRLMNGEPDWQAIENDQPEAA